MSLSCIVQTLWDLCQCQVIIEGNSTFICHLDKNGCTLEEQKDSIKEMKKDVGLLMGLKKGKKEQKQGNC